MGVGSTQAAAIMNDRRTAGSEISREYYDIALNRMERAAAGVLKVRPRNTPVFDPVNAGRSLTTAPWLLPV